MNKLSRSVEENKLALLVTIIDRGGGKKLIKLYNSLQLKYHYVCLGEGTANSELLDLLGLGDPAKDVIFTLMPESLLGVVHKELKNKKKLRNPGRGVAFPIPLGSISRNFAMLVNSSIDEKTLTENQKDVRKMTAERELILAIVNRGFTDAVMDAAKEAGATGGTVIHARSAGHEELGKFIGVTLHPEKEIIAIVAKNEMKTGIMQAINNAAGLQTEARGVVLSLPVGDFIGIGV